MENFLSLCRNYTNLNAVQSELLRRMNTCFPFIADLSHAHLSLYVRCRDKNLFMVLDHHKPHTYYSPVELPEAGRIISRVEEPLVDYTFSARKTIHGKREINASTFLDMYTFLVKENSEIIAVISLETSHGYMERQTYHHILKAVECMLLYCRKPLDATMFRPIAAGDGIILCDKNNRVVYANSAAIMIYKSLGVNFLIGHLLAERQLSLNIKSETVTTSRPHEKELQIGDMVLLQRDIKLEDGGNLLGSIGIVSDVTEVRKKEREIKVQSAVIQEIHHRVKNNLQTIASLLRLQARRSKTEAVREALKESVNRISSIAIVHEYLSQQQNEDINVIRVARSIMENVCHSMLSGDFQLTTELKGDEVVLSSKNASKLALIINELILNSIEHGFKGRSSGVISIDVAENDDEYEIKFRDDGNGLPEGFDLTEVRKSLGLYIIKTLVTEEMGGSFTMQNDRGCLAKIVIPKQEGRS